MQNKNHKFMLLAFFVVAGEPNNSQSIGFFGDGGGGLF
jgi:hypothetical protein